jgi:hypothetical protein
MTKKRAERLLGCEVELRLNPDVPGFTFAYADDIGVVATNEKEALESIVSTVYRVRSGIVAKDQNYRCAHCGKLLNLQSHHKHFRSHGGTHNKSNLVSLCPSCHGKEHRGRK